MMPVDTSASIGDYGSVFSHDSEEAHPAYYAVHLDRYNVDVELTSTLRCGIHRYDFLDHPAEERLLINFPRSNENVRSFHIEQVSDHELRGCQNTGYDVFFHITSNHRIELLDSLVLDRGGFVLDDPVAAGASSIIKPYRRPIPLVHFAGGEGSPWNLIPA